MPLIIPLFCHDIKGARGVRAGNSALQSTQCMALPLIDSIISFAVMGRTPLISEVIFGVSS